MAQFDKKFACSRPTKILSHKLSRPMFCLAHSNPYGWDLTIDVFVSIRNEL